MNKIKILGFLLLMLSFVGFAYASSQTTNSTNMVTIACSAYNSVIQSGYQNALVGGVIVVGFFVILFESWRNHMAHIGAKEGTVSEDELAKFSSRSMTVIIITGAAVFAVLAIFAIINNMICPKT